MSTNPQNNEEIYLRLSMVHLEDRTGDLLLPSRSELLGKRGVRGVNHCYVMLTHSRLGCNTQSAKQAYCPWSIWGSTVIGGKAGIYLLMIGLLLTQARIYLRHHNRCQLIGSLV